MAQVLYRKYRSQNFDQLIGQDHVSSILKNAVLSGMTSHAYLFVGSRGTGKTSTARILAKALNCLKLEKDGNPCDTCENCAAIRDGRFLDLIEIDAASNRGIDQIRELKEKIEFLPVEGKFKIYIIDEVHMLTNEAFNALLKTLEEPPSHVIFMLATTDVHKLPPTILSRCQRYDLKLGTNEHIADVLKRTAKAEGLEIEQDALDIFVESANGSFRDGLSLLDVIVSGQVNDNSPKTVTAEEVRKVLGVPDSELVKGLLSKIVTNDGKGALAAVRKLEIDGINLAQFTKYILKSLQDLLIYNIENNGANSPDYKFAKDLDRREILQLISLFIKAERELKNFPIPALIYEMIIAEFLSNKPGSSSTNGQKPTHTPSETKPAPGTRLASASSPDVKLSSPMPEKSAKVEDKKDIQIMKKSEIEVLPVNEITVTDLNIAKGAIDIIQNLEKQFESSVESSSQPEVDEPSDQTASGLKVDFESIQANWAKVGERVVEHSGSLAVCIKSAKLLGIERNIIRVEVPFTFHKERLEEAKTRDMLSSVFQELFNTSLGIECSVSTNPNKKKRAVTADFVLKNIPAPAESAPKKEEQGSAPSSGNGAPKKEYKVSKKVEAIFEGM